MLFLLLIVITIAIIIAYLVNMRIKHMSLLARNGIPGPKPSLIYGNIFECNKIETQMAWIKTYGKIMGFYDGQKPTVLIADPNLAKNIQIRDFLNFADRPKIPFRHGLNANPMEMLMLHNRVGKRWKDMRSLFMPAFTSAKLKTMTPIMNDSINRFFELMDKDCTNGQEINILEMFRKLTTDMGLRMYFGVESNVQNESNNEFKNAVKHIFFVRIINKWTLLAIQCFPVLDTILFPFRRLEKLIREMLGLSYGGILYGMARDIIRWRKQNPNTNRKDLLQLMFDTKRSGKGMSGMTDENENQMSNAFNDDMKRDMKKRQDITLTEDEIVANVVMFYEGEFEETCAGLGYVTHILVNYPEIQERVRQEVNDVFDSEGKLDVKAIDGLKYMEMVLKETMRQYPQTSTFLTRECLADYKLSKDITVPKGATVMICANYMHFDPDYWPEPERFDPNRFAAERRHELHAYSWQAFGDGPRNCPAIRSAIFEIKLVLAKLLLRYRLEASPNTEIGKLSVEYKVITAVPKNGVFVRAVKL